MTGNAANQIKYVGYYDTILNVDEARNYVLSAASKMDYICSALNRAGRDVLIVSRSSTTKRQFFRGKQFRLVDGVSLKLFSCLPWGNIFQKALSVIAGDIALFLYLALETRRNEPVIAYHSLGLMRSVTWAKRLRGFKLILEVEEIYQDVHSVRGGLQRAEYETFLAADAFIFSTELLEEKLNSQKKPSVVVYGTYRFEECRTSCFNDGRIHAVYAGTFDPNKGGAAAAAAAQFLDSRYHIHILGFGRESDTERLQQVISEVAATSECRLTYDGLLKGDEYKRFMQSCDIGLSTQRADSAFNDTSFPSKVLSYMANGLAVVSVRIRALEESQLAEHITFYDGQDPKSIAEAIKAVEVGASADGRLLLNRLDSAFISDVRSLLARL